VVRDERHHHFGRRSSSAWAKYAAALRRISFALPLAILAPQLAQLVTLGRGEPGPDARIPLGLPQPLP